jgi:fermentation-respiration switch protein FrsA (DUF1100 family)
VILPILAGAAGCFLLALAIGGYVAYDIALRRPRKEPPQEEPPTEEHRDRLNIREAAKVRFHALRPEDVSIRGRDGLTLRGWFFPGPAESRRLAVLAHGYHCDGPGEFAVFLPFYRDLGFHVLIPDHRAHGRSEGKRITFGARESQDFLDWTEAFVRRLGEDTQAVLHGVSMGAATVMLANEKDPPPQVKCVVEDCGYTNAYEEIRHVAKHQLHFHFPPLEGALGLWNRLLAGCSLRKDADCLGNMEKAARPLLVIHGGADDFVPTEMGRRLAAGCRLLHDYVEIPQAAHAMSYYIAAPAYEKALRGFFEAAGLLEAANAPSP